jgi:hypothetical protein
VGSGCVRRRRLGGRSRGREKGEKRLDVLLILLSFCLDMWDVEVLVKLGHVCDGLALLSSRTIRTKVQP